MAYHRDSGGMFGPECEKFLKIFSDFDFETVDDGCNFFCPECREILRCRTYEEIKDEWETFYM